EHQVQEDERVRVPAEREDSKQVEADPEQDKERLYDEERPGPDPRRDLVRQPLAGGRLVLMGLVHDASVRAGAHGASQLARTDAAHGPRLSGSVPSGASPFRPSTRAARLSATSTPPRPPNIRLATFHGRPHKTAVAMSQTSANLYRSRTAGL